MSEIGAPSLALEQYRLMNVKQVQTDTLSHLILSRAATFSLSAIGDITYMTECMESSQIYMSNSQEVRFTMSWSKFKLTVVIPDGRIHCQSFPVREIYSGMCSPSVGAIINHYSDVVV